MKCVEARAALLIADVGELRGRGDSGLVLHLGECAACRSLATALVGDIFRASSRIRSRTRQRFFLLGAVPVAAAVVVAVTMAAGRRPSTTEVVVPRAEHPANVVSVQVGVGQRATVIKTLDPKTTLVWISSGDH